MTDALRAELRPALDRFLPTMKKKGIDLKSGVLASAVLWTLRRADADEGMQAFIRETCGEKAVFSVIKALPPDDDDPLETVQWMMRRITENPLLREAVDALIIVFVDDIVSAALIKPSENQQPSASIMTGDISHVANLVIGGTQYVYGDLVNTITIQQEAIRTCPRPLNPPEYFGGRDRYYAQIKQRLQAGETSAITGVQGVGGIGKTTLARQLAHDLYHGWCKAVVWTDINQHVNVRDKLIQWARYGDQNYQPTQDQQPDDFKGAAQALLEEAINTACETCPPERVLVVLDDVWEDGIEAARMLMSIAPKNAVILITTRSQKVARDLRISDDEALIALPYLSAEDAVAMLRAYPFFAPAADDDLKALAAALGGHPLALDLAARRIDQARRRSGADVVGALHDAVSAYREGIPADSPFADLKFEQGGDEDKDKNDNLTVSLRLSYETLTPEAQARFRALGMLPFDVPFDTALLAALWQSAPEDVENDADPLRELALIDPTNRKGWYTQHRLLRAYARALLNKAGETEAVFGRYAAHMTGLAAQFNLLPLEQWHTLDDHLPHVFLVGDELARKTAITETPDEALFTLAGEFAWNTIRYFHRRMNDIFTGEDAARQPTRINWYEMGLRVWRASSNQGREAVALNYIGAVWDTLGKKRKALDYYEQALPLSRTVGDQRGEAAALNNLGTVWFALGEQPKALEYYEQALPVFRAVGDRDGEATTLSNIGTVWSALGDQRRAISYYEQALALRRSLGNKSGEASVLTNIGAVLNHTGKQRRALDFLQRALPLHRVVGDQRGEAITLNGIGLVWNSLGKQQKALGFYEQALSLYRAVGDRGGEASALNNIGAVWFELGDKRKALGFAEQALVVFIRIEAVDSVASSRTNIGLLLSALGEWEQASEQLEQALVLIHQYNLTYLPSGVSLKEVETRLAAAKRRAAQANPNPPRPHHNRKRHR